MGYDISRPKTKPAGGMGTLQKEDGIPFDSVEDAWFWFMAAQMARADGAVLKSKMSKIPRPCEPVDIFQIVNRLYRGRLLVRDHVMVMAHYGRRGSAPDDRRPAERRARFLWQEAMKRLGSRLRARGIVVRKEDLPNDTLLRTPHLYHTSVPEFLR